MSDSYQAIYDAVRSRISGGNVADAVERVARDAFDMSRLQCSIGQDFSAAAYEMQRPSVMFRPTLFVEGTSWCALLGENLQVGCAGFGDTPDAAMRSFDEAFLKERTPAALRAVRGDADKRMDEGMKAETERQMRKPFEQRNFE